MRDGTPAWEAEVSAVYEDGIIENYFILAVKTRIGKLALGLGLVSNEKIGEDLKSILYSLQPQPDKDGPIKVVPDIQEFLDKWSNDIISHDVEEIMGHYSDKYLDSGETKIAVEKKWKSQIDTIESFEVAVTDFVPEGNRVYLAGYTSINRGLDMLRGTCIIKENDNWKWYGNQRNPISGF